MDIEVSLLVTNTHGGSLIGDAHDKEKPIFPIATSVNNLLRVPPCSYINLTSIPTGNNDRTSLQIQNNGDISVCLTSNRLSDLFINNSTKLTIIKPKSFEEVTLGKGAPISIIPYLEAPQNVAASRYVDENGVNGVFLAWGDVEGALCYRVTKRVMFQENHNEKWHTEQLWTMDTGITCLLDSDYYDFSNNNVVHDTVYYIQAVSECGIAGEKSNYVNLAKIKSSPKNVMFADSKFKE